MTGELPHTNCYYVVPGLLIAGEYPGAMTGSETRQKIRTCLDQGIRYFVDLTEEQELHPYADILHEEATARMATVEHLRLPVPDLSVPPRDNMTAILDAIDAAVADRRKTYVHCWGGVGRTGTVVGCYFVRRGYSGEDALRKLASLWRNVEKAHRKPVSPETAQQRQFVLDWRE